MGRLWDDVFGLPPADDALGGVRPSRAAQPQLYTYSTRFPETEAGAAQKLEHDEDIFNRARLVNCVYFMQIILGGASTTMHYWA